MELVDANVFIRFLTGDVPDQSARARAYLEPIKNGEVAAFTTEAVIAEIAYVLGSKNLYALPHAEVAARLRAIIGWSGLRLPNKRVYLRATELYETTKIDFVDALNVAHMERLGIKTIVAFDRHYDRIPTVTRREP